MAEISIYKHFLRIFEIWYSLFGAYRTLWKITMHESICLIWILIKIV